MSTLHLKAWNFLTTPIEAISVVRYLAHKLPASEIAEYRIFRDRNIPNQYQTYLDVRFRDQIPDKIMDNPDSVDNEGDPVIQVPLPPFREYPIGSGGIPLEELRWMLRPYSKETWDKYTIDPETGQPHRVLDVKVSRARTEFFTLGQSGTTSTTTTPQPPNSSPFSREFVKWGGFARIEPIQGGSQILDHVNMRSSLREHAALGGVVNPLEYAIPEPEPEPEVVPEKPKKPKPEPVVRKPRSLITKNLPSPTVSADQLLSSTKKLLGEDRQEVGSQIRAMRDLLKSRKRPAKQPEIIETVMDPQVEGVSAATFQPELFKAKPQQQEELVFERIPPKQQEKESEPVSEEESAARGGGLSFLKSFLMQRRAKS